MELFLLENLSHGMKVNIIHTVLINDLKKILKMKRDNKN